MVDEGLQHGNRQGVENNTKRHTVVTIMANEYAVLIFNTLPLSYMYRL